MYNLQNGGEYEPSAMNLRPTELEPPGLIRSDKKSKGSRTVSSSKIQDKILINLRVFVYLAGYCVAGSRSLLWSW